MSDQELKEFEVHASEIGLDLTKFDGIAAPWASVETSKHWQTWCAARAALAHQAVPEGFALVPVDPTEDNITCMVRAICEAAADRLVALAVSQAPAPGDDEPAGVVGCDDYAAAEPSSDIAHLTKRLPTGTKLYTRSAPCAAVGDRDV